MSASQNEVVYGGGFRKDVRRLPAVIQTGISEAIEILKNNPFDSRLHTKSLSAPLRGMFSFRVMRDYRVGFKFRATNVILLLAADRRERIYKRLIRKK